MLFKLSMSGLKSKAERLYRLTCWSCHVDFNFLYVPNVSAE